MFNDLFREHLILSSILFLAERSSVYDYSFQVTLDRMEIEGKTLEDESIKPSSDESLIHHLRYRLTLVQTVAENNTWETIHKNEKTWVYNPLNG